MFSQSGDSLDFLEKVENIKIPEENSGSGSEIRIKQDSTKTGSVSTSPTKATKSTAPVTTKTTKSVPKKTTATATSNQSPSPSQTTIAPTTKQSTSTVKTTEPAKPAGEKTWEEGDLGTGESRGDSVALWVGEPLAMEPDFLPGFDQDTKSSSESGQSAAELEPKTKVEYPLPQVSGNYNPWKSLVDFFSQYTKAFFIFGMILLFLLFRLRAGKTSSSRRSTPTTIRKLRR